MLETWRDTNGLVMAVEAKLTPVVEFVLSRWRIEYASRTLHMALTTDHAQLMAGWLLKNRSKSLDPLLKVALPLGAP